MKIRSVFAAALVVAAALWAHPSAAITVLNNSFENPIVSGTGGFSVNDITSWSGSGAWGVYNAVSPTQYPIGSNGLSGGLVMPGGNQVAYIGSGASSITQTLSDALQVGTYTFSFYVGNRADFAWGTGVTATLFAGGFAAGNIEAFASIADPGDGRWALVTLTDVVTAGDSNLGGALSIRFSQTGGTQTNFDLVSLDLRTAAVPGPIVGAGLPGLAIALGGLVVLARRRRMRVA